MLRTNVKAGLRAAGRRPGLAVLVYGAHAVLGLWLTAPLYAALAAAVADTGFSADLAASFDLVLWWDLLERAGTPFADLTRQLLWTLPVYLLLHVALTVGLIHALRMGGGWSFWTGVGRYTARGLALAALYLLPTVLWLILCIALAGLLMVLWTGSVATFWTLGVVTPLLLLGGWAGVDLMRDYGTIALVAGGQSVSSAWSTGLAWPFRYPAAGLLYGGWMLVALLLLLAPAALEVALNAATAPAIWGLFAVQQLCLLLRAGTTVAWLGSEVDVFEVVQAREAPLIAGDDPVPPAAGGALA